MSEAIFNPPRTKNARTLRYSSCNFTSHILLFGIRLDRGFSYECQEKNEKNRSRHD